MSEGRTSKSTVYVGGLADDVDENILIEVFSTFGDIMEVQLPTSENRTFSHGPPERVKPEPTNNGRHRGFAFITFGTALDAQDAIDNMDLNELRGKVLKVNTARPMKGPAAGQGNRAIWESEDWLKAHGTQAAGKIAVDEDDAGGAGPAAAATEDGADADDMQE
ncbi:hypothetical protein FRB94_009423 [Tulasnella sp. JGI-2019a]|nr:hypothetical protein FRB93_006476 [Tulasnella sp. JGI-2019a]KAG9010943.1 hypothetical protein FRB94_009423 [Tulasnella sp. JGI-2019a]KAG9038423.1 hypothetical protein FRB95_001280 [Tulasnella sp. JGI-2019a]